MLLRDMENPDPMELGKMIQALIGPEKYSREGLNEPRDVGMRGPMTRRDVLERPYGELPYRRS